MYTEIYNLLDTCRVPTWKEGLNYTALLSKHSFAGIQFFNIILLFNDPDADCIECMSASG